MVKANPPVRLLRLGTLEIFAPLCAANISRGGYACEMHAEPGEGGRFSWLIALNTSHSLTNGCYGSPPLGSSEGVQARRKGFKSGEAMLSLKVI